MVLLQQGCLKGFGSQAAPVTMWGRALCDLMYIHELHVNSIYNRTWRTKLRKAKVYPSKYSLQDHLHPNAVYLKFHRNQTMFYVGSTSVGVHKRDQTRLRKLRQLQKNRLVHCEPALRWWHKHGRMLQFSSIVIFRAQSKQEAQNHRGHVSTRVETTTQCTPTKTRPSTQVSPSQA